MNTKIKKIRYQTKKRKHSEKQTLLPLHDKKHTFKQLKTRAGGAILNLHSSPINLMFFIFVSMLI